MNRKVFNPKEASMPDTKLLPCPFCGGPADVLARPLGVAVECRWCDSAIGGVIHDAAAIEKWNTRAALQASGKGEPLSEAQLKELILQTVYEGDGTIAYRDQWSQDIGIPFARAIEAAHGIQAKGDKP